jgi:hypothetical protein
MFEAIQYIGTGLTLIAFVVAVAAFAYQHSLSSKERQLRSIPAKDRLAAAQTAADYIKVDLTDIPQNQRANIVMETLRLKAQRQLQFFIGFVVLAFLMGIGTLVAMTFPPSLPPAATETTPTPRSTAATNGWAWAGYLDKDDPHIWSVGPFVDIESYSGSSDRPFPIRTGDVVRPKKDIPQVIVGYKSIGTENVLHAPPGLTDVINPDRDYTGLQYEATKTYLVNDVQVWGSTGMDPVMWLRLTPGDPDRTRTEQPKAAVIGQPANQPESPVSTTVSYRVCIGENERECEQHNVFLGCGSDIQGWAAMQCRALGRAARAVDRMSSREGNMCGYAVFNVECTVTQ